MGLLSVHLSKTLLQMIFKAQFGILTNQAPELGYNIIHS